MAGNAELVRTAYAAFGRGDIGAILELLDDGVEWSSPTTLPQGGDFVGKGGAQRFFEGMGAAWDSFQLDVEAVGEVGDRLVVGIVRGSGALRDGGPAEYGATHVFTIEDDKVTAFREFVDLPAPLGS